MRLFFALWPDNEVTAQLVNAAARLHLNNAGRLVSAQNYHLTVAFLGEVEPARLETLGEIGQSAARVASGTIILDSMEFWRKSQAVVAAARIVPPGLFRLWNQLQQALALTETQFRAHVTLARKVLQAPELQAMSAIRWRPTTMALVRSRTAGAESAYTVVATWALLDER